MMKTDPNTDRPPGVATSPRGQLEFHLEAPDRPARSERRPARRPDRPRRVRRVRLAGWWFNRMREAVRTARDWPEAGETWPAEQTSLALVGHPSRLDRSGWTAA